MNRNASWIESVSQAFLLAVFVAAGAALPQGLAAEEVLETAAKCCRCGTSETDPNSVVVCFNSPANAGQCSGACTLCGGLLVEEFNANDLCNEAGNFPMCQVGVNIFDDPNSPGASGLCAVECTDDEDCDDSNVCTDDSCDSTGGCQYTNNTLSCDDGDACTENEACSGGSCTGGTAVNCDDTNVCTDDSCDSTGGCQYTNNTAPCDDGEFCNGDDTCLDGSCSQNAGDPCVSGFSQSAVSIVDCSQYCNEAEENCDAPSGVPCDDGLFCTQTDACDGSGTCAGSGDPCSGGSECANSCSEASGGTCYDPQGTGCTADGDPCTNDVCDGSGTCGVPNSAPCDDTDPCTENDVCSGGTCAGTEKDCSDGVDCTDDTCDGSGVCQHTPNDSYCDDINPCTDDYCNAPVCAGIGAAEPVDCNTLGGCAHDNNTDPCNDGNPCTEGDTCSGGTCGAGSQKDCDDAIGCTDDTCDGSGVCQHTPNDSLCNDSDACTNDVCNPAAGCENEFEDEDEDAVCDADDPHPSIFDPTGCFYDEVTGQVIPGGLVTPSGPGTIDVGLTGASGCYQFSVTGLPADPNYAPYTLLVSLPPNCARSTTCLADPNALDPTGLTNPLVLGPYNVGGYINPHDCGSNPFYLTFELSADDPTILNNNIPLQCEFAIPPVPAPAMSPWAIAVSTLLLIMTGLVALRVRRSDR